ncbi:GHKL domain-containing protein [Salicibibacter cibi]|uniref:histidine kinase n=1 Tax=Salicibibacter cibi TaxID=2743001 RepID=A0A7T6ZBF1_9BACI|nr:ATP-binding protein [Salicibibacter cibi]QQK80353.1 GHKL domain-containing protein [Salicibibacter cibi]
MTKKKKWPLQYRIMVYAMALLFGTLLLAGILMAYSQAEQARQSLEDQAVLSASHLAESPMVIDALITGEADEELRELLANLRTENDLLYIVIMDMDGIRLTHPTPERIGEEFVGPDVADVLEQGEAYTSEEVGTLGPSMRAFRPIIDDDEQIGAISVGISTERIDNYVSQSQRIVYISTGLSLILGAGGAYILARRIKRTLHGLEPEEIAQRLQEREAMLESVHEGVVATDNKGKIIVTNNTATATLGNYTLGKAIEDVWPALSIDEQIYEGKTTTDDMQWFKDIQMITSRMPVMVGNETVGALITFRDRSELDRVLERLVGVEHYAQQLRLQTHEFMNKLHIIGAMVYTKSYTELEDYIDSLSIQYEKGINEIGQHIKDITLAGYITNQIERLEKAGVTVYLHGETSWPVLTNTEQLDRWITVIGNALDNAYEAMIDRNEKTIDLTFERDEDMLCFLLKDSGKGFDVKKLPRFIEQGVSSKGAHRGFGLSLMAEAIMKAGGTYAFDSTPGEGTVFTARIPLKRQEDKR